MNEEKFDVGSLTLNAHPMLKVKPKLRNEYFTVLDFLVSDISDTFVKHRLQKYFEALRVNRRSDTDIEELIENYILCAQKPWRKKYVYYILLDLYLIINNEVLFTEKKTFIESRLDSNRSQKLNLFLQDIYQRGISDIAGCGALGEEVKRNHDFTLMKTKTIIITANMSAGKSTLINALTGKNLMRTSQEVCTAHLNKVFSKPFEDDETDLISDTGSSVLDEETIRNIEEAEQVNICTFFRTCSDDLHRICLIDTPGVNSTFSTQHRELARNAIGTGDYDYVVCVLNANKLGTEEENEHLTWLAGNVDKRKIVFVINKLDDFHGRDDNIGESIANIKKDLKNLGFKEPIICPVSAYFALLLKKERYNDYMDEDEMDQLGLFKRKFSRDDFNLAKYYPCTTEETDKFTFFEQRSGIWGLEKILFN